MSGGHYNYVCDRIQETAEEITHQKDHQPTRQIILELLVLLGKIMYEVEWEDSGDGGDWKKVDKMIRELFNISEVTLENIKKVKKYEMITEIVTQ